MASELPPYTEGPNPAFLPQHTSSKPEKSNGLQRSPEKTDGYEDSPDSIPYIRDPHKLVAYLIPFPTPHLQKAPASAVPTRFLIYTPPPPPLYKPAEGEKERVVHKVQRKWQEEVRSAKTTTAPTKTVKGMRYKLTRGVNKAMVWTTTSNIDFVGRISPSPAPAKPKSTSGSTTPNPQAEPALDRPDGKSDAKVDEKPSTSKANGIEEIVFVYPPTMDLSPDEMRAEFIHSMLRTKSKATRDTIISTGLLPIAWGIDIVAVGVGGLGEVATFWAYISVMGLKNSRNVTKRLNADGYTPASGSVSASATKPAHDDSSATTGSEEASSSSSTSAAAAAATDTDAMTNQPQLTLTFLPSPRLELLRAYLDAECHRVDNKLFLNEDEPPSDADVLQALGWSPEHFSESERRDEEDEEWEAQEVRDDLRATMHKGAKEWRSWCRAYEKGPEKVLKKAETGKK